MLYSLCTNGSRALGRWTRCQGQRSAVLQWWTSSCPRHLTTKYLPFPSHPAQRHATPRRAPMPMTHIFIPPFISSCAPHSLCPTTFGRPKGTCYLHNKRLPTFCLAAAVNRFVLCAAAPRHARVQFYNRAFASAMMCTFFAYSRLSRRESVELIVESSASVETGIEIHYSKLCQMITSDNGIPCTALPYESVTSFF